MSDSKPAAEPRAGRMLRYVNGRTAHCECACGRTFDSTGTAASHARAHRHVVTVEYRSTFRFVPEEVAPPS